jgi:hypothetical protein
MTPFTTSPGLLLRVYGTAIFLSAALLFAVQPMFTKMVLPQLGGSPAVWSVAMVFFQAMLLAGYAYAHAITRSLPGRPSVIVHVAVMAAAALALPLSIASGWGRPPVEGAAFWLLGLFTVSIGLPFFALAANGPLLQAWFARTDHPAAGNPYFLYAASNVGSFLALISYPFAIEPFTRLGAQTRGWTVLYVVLIALVAACGVLMLRAQRPAETPDREGVSSPPPTWSDAAIWVALAAVPSALLIAVTVHISTDIAAAPFLWVIPLALYLVTFVIVFQTRPVLRHEWMVAAAPFFIVALVGVMVFEVTSYALWLLALNVATFFVIAMVCHGELSRRRPPAEHLTAFYMWMSTGGVIGGIFSGLIAPNVFSWVMEYPALIVLAILCRPGLALPTDTPSRLLWLGAIAVVAVAAFPGVTEKYVTDEKVFHWTIGAMLVAAGLVSREPLPFAAVIAVVFIVANLYQREDSTRETVRSFFGVHKITETSDGQYRVLLDGTTIHGAERIRDAGGNALTDPPQPITYYHRSSPMAVAIKAVRARAAGPISVAVVGLGTGTLACYAEPGDAWRYYEIDFTMVDIAKDPKRFNYLSRCAPDMPITMGDARISLAETSERYDLIVVDAFSSDAIPIHLVTREAMAIYKERLTEQGIVLMHVSNRHLELATVVAGIAHANGLVTRVNNRASRGDEEDARYLFTSTVAISARAEADFGALLDDQDWTALEPDPTQWVWTDDYSNVIGSIIRQLRR